MEDTICSACHGVFGIDRDSIVDIVHCPYCLELVEKEVVDHEDDEEEDPEFSEEDLTQDDTDSDEDE